MKTVKRKSTNVSEPPSAEGSSNNADVREERIVNKTVVRIQEIMMQSGFIKNNDNSDKTAAKAILQNQNPMKGKNNKNHNRKMAQLIVNDLSETTIYKPAIKVAAKESSQKRKSWSSEEELITSNKSMNKMVDNNDNDLINNFITECRIQDEVRRREPFDNHPRPSTSGFQPRCLDMNRGNETTRPRPVILSPEQRADQII